MFEAIAQIQTPRDDWNPSKFDPKLTVQDASYDLLNITTHTAI